MDKEKTAFINVLADYVNQRNSSITMDLDMDVFLKFIRHHQLSGLFYKQCKIEELKNEYYAQLYNSVALSTLRTELEAELVDVDYFIIKGSEIAKFYPDPILRSMGDIDLVVRKADKESVHNRLIQIGYMNTNCKDAEWVYYKNGMEVELHDKLIYDLVFDTEPMKLLFNNCWKYYEDHKVSMSFHVAYLIAHLRKHLLYQGVGFRQFLDIAIVSKYAEIDWKEVKELLEKTGLLMFAKNVFSLISVWFGIDSPILVNEIDPEFYEEATNKIFMDGVFGHDNKDNYQHMSINQILKSGKISLFKKFLVDIFPSRERILENPKYLYVERYHALILFAWCHRLGSKLNSLKGIRKTYFPTNREIDNRTQLIRKWGL